MELDELMAAFAAETKLEGLAPDSEGVYQLNIDDMVVAFREDANERRLVTESEVCTLADKGAQCIYQVLFEAMFLGQVTGDGWFAFAPDSDRVLFQRSDYLDLLDLEKFKAMLEDFLNRVEQWRHSLGEFRKVVNELETSTAATPDGGLSRQDASDFIRI